MNCCDITSWLTSIGTVGTLITALILIILQINDRKKQKKTELEYIARKVSAWVDFSNPPARLFFQNLSDEPVYNILIRVKTNEGDFETDVSKLIPEYENIFSITLIQPHGKEYVFFNNIQFSGTFYQIQISFTDASGNSWTREPNGKIVKNNT